MLPTFSGFVGNMSSFIPHIGNMYLLFPFVNFANGLYIFLMNQLLISLILFLYFIFHSSLLLFPSFNLLWSYFVFTFLQVKLRLYFQTLSLFKKTIWLYKFLFKHFFGASHKFSYVVFFLFLYNSVLVVAYFP